MEIRLAFVMAECSKKWTWHFGSQEKNERADTGANFIE